ncbi:MULTISPECIES: hypothetical protein [unclassified Mesorhizobium]|uniref:hypothetical protein n=1 Tax=unclassified Mesorhizobium TaxID=325217 RepID=UPI000BB05E36|nr:MULTISPECIES: hypothetical protein [unclassified Mesorhizobium]TGT60992.1 hypothetical protein EN813_018650 [Mesorhizobium sp. M00.F.Ca.ET.170.01.1.1]AZO08759.1 hypothetical protein EJ074_06270 [Mesorhizobium sp. M3A.F.Ca.ET.080.04.2.1]PBB84093.1 hypothetical protein CK216_25285 [Mesorhizobium sp. WSM3876]RWB72116.1 MAG: hypothetical protein EOQ49_12785 [Mesorhizobium sp.]RWB83679.1 MAG: hypothetical protein EOQ52_26095 [Mesorhizobium sp.]
MDADIISGIAVTSIVVGLAGQAVLLWIACRGLGWTPAMQVASKRRARFADGRNLPGSSRR